MRQAVSAGWVIPVDGPPIADAFVAWEDGRIVEVGPGRAERHYDDALILPGLVNAHSHLEYAVYAGFGDGLAFGGWLATTSPASAGSKATTWSRSRGSAPPSRSPPGITTTADYSFSGAAATAANDLGLRAIVYLEVFGGDAAEAEQRFDGLRAQVDETELVRIGISPHAPYTCSVDVYRYCLSLGIPVGTHLAESDGENEWLEHGTGPLAAAARRARAAERPARGRDARRRARAGAPLRPLRHGRGARDRRARCGRRSRRPLPSLERAARLRRRAADRAPRRRDPRRARHRLARPRRRRSTPSTSFERPWPPPGRASGAPTHSTRAERSGSLPWMQRAPWASKRDIGSLSPGKRADLTVVSVAGSAYDPVEDPSVAAVYGGAPSGVLETIVDGKTRYRQGETAWQEVRSTASAARRRMLA